MRYDEGIVTFTEVHMPRRITCLLGALLLSTLLFPTLAAAQTKPSATKDTRLSLIAPDAGAIIVYCEGLVKANGAAVDIGSRIADGTTVTTAPDGFAEIVFNHKNILRVAGGSIVKLSLSGLRRSVELDMGAVGAVLHRLDKLAGGGLELHTPGSVAAVRGTTLFGQVEADSANASYYCICNGKLELSDTDGAHARDLEATHHRAIERVQTSEGPQDSDRPLVGHDDAMMQALAARIGDSIDWTTLED